MPRNKGWFRLYDRMIDSPEILELDDTEFRLLVSLWSLASASGQDGSLPGFRPASIQRRVMPHCTPETIEIMIAHFTALGLVEGDAGAYRICRWEQHQYEYPSKFPSKRRKDTDETIAHTTEAREQSEESDAKPLGSVGEVLGKESGRVGQIDPETDPDKENNNNAREVYQMLEAAYVETFGGSFNPEHFKVLQNYLVDSETPLDLDVIVDAFTQCKLYAQHKNWGYVQQVLRNRVRDKLTTMALVQDAEQKRQRASEPRNRGSTPTPPPYRPFENTVEQAEQVKVLYGRQAPKEAIP